MTHVRATPTVLRTPGGDRSFDLFVQVVPSPRSKGTTRCRHYFPPLTPPVFPRLPIPYPRLSRDPPGEMFYSNSSRTFYSVWVRTFHDPLLGRSDTPFLLLPFLEPYPLVTVLPIPSTTHPPPLYPGLPTSLRFSAL